MEEIKEFRPQNPGWKRLLIPYAHLYYLKTGWINQMYIGINLCLSKIFIYALFFYKRDIKKLTFSVGEETFYYDVRITFSSTNTPISFEGALSVRFWKFAGDSFNSVKYASKLKDDNTRRKHWLQSKYCTNVYICRFIVKAREANYYLHTGIL